MHISDGTLYQQCSQMLIFCPSCILSAYATAQLQPVGQMKLSGTLPKGLCRTVGKGLWRPQTSNYPWTYLLRTHHQYRSFAPICSGGKNDLSAEDFDVANQILHYILDQWQGINTFPCHGGPRSAQSDTIK